MDWKRLLACITGTVDQELLLRNAYLVTENRILRNQLQGRVRLSDGERQSLEEIGKKAREAGFGGDRDHCETRHHSRLAPHAGRPEV